MGNDKVIGISDTHTDMGNWRAMLCPYVPIIDCDLERGIWVWRHDFGSPLGKARRLVCLDADFNRIGVSAWASDSSAWTPYPHPKMTGIHDTAMYEELPFTSVVEMTLGETYHCGWEFQSNTHHIWPLARSIPPIGGRENNTVPHPVGLWGIEQGAVSSADITLGPYSAGITRRDEVSSFSDYEGGFLGIGTLYPTGRDADEGWGILT